MNRRVVLTILALFAADAIGPLRAQAPPAATQEATLTIFGGGTGTYTGLGSGKNVGITAGVDIAIYHSGYFMPFLEVRGSYPFYSGSTESIRDILGGLRFTRSYGAYRPYFDVLYGRAEINYENGGYPNPSTTYLYKKSPANVLSLGGGMEYPISYTWAIQGDVQWQLYSSPVSSSGHLSAVPVTVGIVYSFRPP